MPLQFPTPASQNQIYTNASGKRWKFNGTIWNAINEGLQGTQGIQGIQGTQGAQGLQGIQGIQGTQGAQGIQGIQGIQGTQGTQGIQGIQGITGLAFTIAKTYVSVAALTADTAPTNIVSGQFALINTSNVEDADNSKLYLWNGSIYIFQNDLSGTAGIQGITGSTGAQGTQGTQGIQGLQGITGAQGTQGIQGTQGTQGTQGIQGLQGITGAQGITGSTGAQGTVGTTGSTGTTGATGSTGATGGTGAQGTIGTSVTGAQGTVGTSGATILGNNQTWTGYNTYNTPFRRGDHAVGFLEGSYNNVGGNSVNSNPIYTIGSSYNPTNTALSNMYGIGYSHSNFWGGSKGGGWGMYVTSGGAFRGTFGCESDPNTWISGYGLSDTSWRAPLFYDSNNTAYYTDQASTSNYNRLNLVGFDSSGRNYSREWIEFPNLSGLYSPTNGAHFYPNGASSYGSWNLQGSRNGWAGIYFSTGGNTAHYMLESGNGGLYFESGGRWANYYSYGNNCTGFGTSSTSSAFNIYCPTGVYSGGRVDGTIFYDASDTAYYCDPNSSGVSLRIGGAIQSNHVAWTGEMNKIQWHANHLYLQNINNGYLLILRRADGSNMFLCDANGDVTASGNITAYSDRRLKENIETIPNALSLVQRLRGVTFDWIETKKHGYGVIAQEVEEVIPELVHEADDGAIEGADKKTIKSVDYSKMVSVLIEAIKEQQQQIEKQQSQIDELKLLVQSITNK